MADDVSPEVKEAKKTQAIAEAQAAQYKAEKDAADARTAAINASITAQKAKIGSIDANTVQAGAVTTGDSAGNAEATMLSAKSASNAAGKIAETVNTLIANPGANVVVVAGNDKLSLGHFQAYKLQLRVLDETFRRAESAKAAADTLYDAHPPTGGGRVHRLITEYAPIAMGIGMALDLASKIASYFQTEYKFSGATVTGVDDNLLAEAVAGKLSAKTTFPGRWSGTTILDALTDELDRCAQTYAASLASLNQTQTRSQALKDAAKADGTEDQKKQWTVLAAHYDAAAEFFKAAQKTYDSLLTSLATADAKGQPAAIVVAEEKFIAKALAQPGTYVLFVRMNNAAGANYTKKNIWTFLGVTPFYVMGGATASFVLVSGDNGLVKGSGLYAFSSGYLSVAEVKDALQ